MSPIYGEYHMIEVGQPDVSDTESRLERQERRKLLDSITKVCSKALPIITIGGFLFTLWLQSNTSELTDKETLKGFQGLFAGLFVTSIPHCFFIACNNRFSWEASCLKVINYTFLVFSILGVLFTHHNTLRLSFFSTTGLTISIYVIYDQYRFSNY